MGDGLLGVEESDVRLRRRLTMRAGGDAGVETTDTPGVTAVSETTDSTGAEVGGSKDLAEGVGAGTTMEA